MGRRRLSALVLLLLAGALMLGSPACTPLRTAAAPRTAVPSATPYPTATSRPSPTATPTTVPSPTLSPTVPPSPTPDAMGDLLSRMTLEDKVGQMLMAGVSESGLNEPARHAVSDLGVGSVVLTGNGAQGPEQVRALTSELQALAAERTIPVPLFISANHEGGAIMHIPGATDFPSAMALGAGGSPDMAYAAGLHSAEELVAMGINMNLAPVLDVNSEPDNPIIGLRSFGANAEAVGLLGAAFIRGTQEAGVVAVGKHFPGHGSVDVDSHYALPVVRAGADNLWASDLAPFRQAIAGGVEAIMSAHLDVPALTGEAGLPATLSPAVLTGLLRERMGFQGLIVTDDLDMKGVAGQESAGEAAVQAIEAGADVLLLTSPDSQQAAFDAVLAAVQDGRLEESRLDRSVRRILALKAEYGLFQPKAQPLEIVGSAEHQALARQAAMAAVTVVQRGGLPLDTGRRTLVISPSDLPAGQEAGWTLFGQEIAQRAATCREITYAPADPAGIGQALAEAQALAGEYDQVIVGLWDTAGQGDASTFEGLAALAEAGSPPAVVAWQLPYDLAQAPPGAAAVATLGATEDQVRAAAAVLYGEAEAGGRLPVPLD